MLPLLLRPRRIVSLALLVALVVGGVYGWRRVHRSAAASEPSALADVRAAGQAPPGRPRTGVYGLAQSGTENIGVSFLRLRRSLPGRALLVVRREGAARRVETRYSTDDIDAWRVIFDARKGWRATWRSIRVGILGYGHAIEGSPTQIVVLYPRRLSIGQRWETVYNVGGVAFQRSSVVRARQTVQVGGRTYPAFRVETVERARGALSGEETTRALFAPALGMEVQRTVTRDYDGVLVDRLSLSLALTSPDPIG